MADFSTEYARYFRLTEDALPRFLPDQPGPWDTVADAMRYSLLGGGKRIRAVLALSVCEICGGRLQDVLPFACAIEPSVTRSLSARLGAVLMASLTESPGCLVGVSGDIS